MMRATESLSSVLLLWLSKRQFHLQGNKVYSKVTVGVPVLIRFAIRWLVILDHCVVQGWAVIHRVVWGLFLSEKRDRMLGCLRLGVWAVINKLNSWVLRALKCLLESLRGSIDSNLAIVIRLSCETSFEFWDGIRDWLFDRGDLP